VPTLASQSKRREHATPLTYSPNAKEEHATRHTTLTYSPNPNAKDSLLLIFWAAVQNLQRSKCPIG
jgi:hypothetical protein